MGPSSFFYSPLVSPFYDASARSSFKALSITDMTSLTTSSDVGASFAVCELEFECE